MAGYWERIKGLVLGRQFGVASRSVEVLVAQGAHEWAAEGGGLDQGIDHLLPTLAGAGLEPTATELADILWFAAHLDVPLSPTCKPSPEPEELAPHHAPPTDPQQDRASTNKPPVPKAKEQSKPPPSVDIYPAGAEVKGGRPALGFRAPAEPALANALDFYRALRPLYRRVPSSTRRVLDEEATAERIAEQRISGHLFWEPAWVPAREPWFELVLVVDQSATMVMWGELLDDLRRLFDNSGAFRRVRLWDLNADDARPRLFAGRVAAGLRSGKPETLFAGPERSLILVVSDCVATAWHTGAVHRWLARWSCAAPVAVLQLLPQRLWDSTALGRGQPVRLRSRRPGAPGNKLEPLGGPALRLAAAQLAETDRTILGLPSNTAGPDLCLPVLTLEPHAVLGWGRLLGAAPDAWCGGVQFGSTTEYASAVLASAVPRLPDELEVQSRLANFQANASSIARRLASLLAAAPLTLPVMRLVQRTRLPESGQIHLAEIFVSGLLHPHPGLDGSGDQPFYDFHGDCRNRLLDGLGESEARGVLNAVSNYVAERTGRVLDFAALLVAPSLEALVGAGASIGDANTRHFASIGASVLRRFGGSYAQLADALTALAKGDATGLPRADTPTAHVTDHFVLPSINLLNASGRGGKAYTDDELWAQSSSLEVVLKDMGVEGQVVAIYHGPSVTLFEVELAPDVEVGKISGRAEQFASALAKANVRVIKVIPGKSCIGIEIPNEPREAASDSFIIDPGRTTSRGYSDAQIEDLSRLVEVKLKDFGVVAQVVAAYPGPVVTLFELQLAPGTKSSKISGLSKDLARALSKISVRVVEVIPGKSWIGIEIPNEERETVFLSEILGSAAYQDAKSPLSLALGSNISGEPVVVDLAKMPHALIAGTTGSGKSVAINAMILSLLYKDGPKDVRLIMVDPKMLELSIYEGIPHLLTPVVTDMKEAANALRWCVGEMERRYRLMAALGVRNIGGYNRKVGDAEAAGTPLRDPLLAAEFAAQPGVEVPTIGHLPYIVVIIDELADMMMVVGKKVEELIARLAQKARASGIHLMLATQRPSVDVLTGLIKANIPTRISFQVSSRIDSRTVLDQMGAETLLGHGDMLYLPPDGSIPQRVHGAFVDDHEVHNVVNFLKAQGAPKYLADIVREPRESLPGIDPEPRGEVEDADPLFDEAVQFVVEGRRASISAVQRRLKIGYNRAARMLQEMERIGIVGPAETNSNREVLAPPITER